MCRGHAQGRTAAAGARIFIWVCLICKSGLPRLAQRSRLAHAERAVSAQEGRAEAQGRRSAQTGVALVSLPVLSSCHFSALPPAHFESLTQRSAVGTHTAASEAGVPRRDHRT